MTVTAPPEITAENVATIFPEVDTSLARNVLPTANANASREGTELEGYDEEQVRLMEEVCIVLDNEDRPIGSGSKKLCEKSQSLFSTVCLTRELERGNFNGSAHEQELTCTFYLYRPLDDQH